MTIGGGGAGVKDDEKFRDVIYDKKKYFKISILKILRDG
jgi:hypothetical protein